MELCQPKKPSFKKAFAVPKLKSDSDISEPKACIKSVKNNDPELKEQISKPSPSKEEDSQIPTDLNKENTSTLVTSKKTKIKKNLFQAPCVSEIDTKEDLDKKKKKTKKTLKEESGGTSDENVKPKKIRKKKESNDDQGEASKPKKTKVSKEKKKEVNKPKETLPLEPVNMAETKNRQDSEIDKEDSDTNVKNGEVEGPTEKTSEHTDEQEVEIESKTSKTDKPQTTDSTASTAPRSLTDQEYQEIFQAVLDRCSNTSLEEMFESLKKPVIPKPEKKCKAVKKENNLKTAERKPKKAKESGNQVVPKCDKFDDENLELQSKGVNKSKNVDCNIETEENVDSESEIDEKEGKLEADEKVRDDESETDEKEDDETEIDEKVGDKESDMDEKEKDGESETDEIMEEETSEVCQAISQLIPDEVINGLQSLSSTIEPNYQGVNEATPEGSEIEYKIPCQKTPPPKKSKKSENLSSNKKMKLAPKQLNFPVKTADVKHVKEHEKSSKKRLKLGESTELKKLKKDKVKKNETVVREHEKSSKKKLKTEGSNEFNKPVKDKGKSRAELTGNKEKSRRKELQERLDSREKLGTWVQCGNKACSKWRFLPDCEDPSVLPEIWTCKMNKDDRYSSCDIDEQNYDENEHIFTTFAEGSVVWAKMAGFPWWPAMVEIDPDTESYFTLLTPYSMYPSHYQVTFFDDKVSRAWVNSASIRKFTGTPEDDDLNPKPSKSGKGFASHSKDISKAKVNALLAYDMSVQDRLKNFSFAKRYKGTYGKVYQSDESSQEMLKTKKTTKKKKRNSTKISSDLIDSALEQSRDNDEDAVLKGFEEVLDALDDDDDEDCSDDNDADEDYNMSENDNEKGETGQERKRVKTGTRNLDSRQKHNSCKKKGDNLTFNESKKQKMFIISNEEEEMVVPTLHLDDDIFTMEMEGCDDETNTTVNTKSVNLTEKTNQKAKNFAVPKFLKQKKDDREQPVVKTEDVAGTDLKENTKTEQNILSLEQSEDISNSEGDENTAQPHNDLSTDSNITTGTQQSNIQTENLLTDNVVRQSENFQTEIDCTSRVDHPIEIDRRTDEVLSLEQDEQTVPGEDSPDSEDFSLEISTPSEDKHQSQVIVRTFAPVTVELAYDSDPMDIEE